MKFTREQDLGYCDDSLHEGAGYAISEGWNGCTDDGAGYCISEGWDGC